MHTRTARITVVVVLLAVGAAAAFVAWRAERRIDSLEQERRGRESVLERILPAVAAITAAQQAYVDYGLRDETSFTRVSSLVDQITTDAAGFRSSGQSAEGAAHLEQFWSALSALSAADAEAREKLAAGDSLGAADLLFGASRPHTAAIETQLRAFRAAEFSQYTVTRQSLAARAFIVIGAVALLWATGLIVLARVPRPRAATAPSPAEQLAATKLAAPPPAPEAAPSPAELGTVDTTPAQDPQPPPALADPAVDLPSAAALCSDIARLTDPAAMSVLLARAQRILDARGLVIWMGAGDSLFAAAASGYESAVVRRLPPISRSANNVTAAAWRTGELRAVAADAMTLGAVVAPMFGPGGCIGVLAAEVRNGRESDPAIRALATVIASQFSTVLAAWPAASGSSGAGSDRKAAAS